VAVFRPCEDCVKEVLARVFEVKREKVTESCKKINEVVNLKIINRGACRKYDGCYKFVHTFSTET
jgi:hypothetical protein